MQFLCATLNRYFCASRPQRLSPPATHYHFNHCFRATGDRHTRYKCLNVLFINILKLQNYLFYLLYKLNRRGLRNYIFELSVRLCVRMYVGLRVHAHIGLTGDISYCGHSCSHPRQWRHSSTVCGVVHMTDSCPITGHLADKNFLIRILFKDSY